MIPRPPQFNGPNVPDPKNPRPVTPGMNDLLREDELIFIKNELSDKMSYFSYALSHKEQYSDLEFQNLIITIIDFYNTGAYKANLYNIRDYFNIALPIYEHMKANHLISRNAYKAAPFYEWKFVEEWPTTTLTDGVPKINRGEYKELIGTTRFEDIIDTTREMTCVNWEPRKCWASCEPEIMEWSYFSDVLPYFMRQSFKYGRFDVDHWNVIVPRRQRHWCEWWFGLPAQISQRTTMYREEIAQFWAEKAARRAAEMKKLPHDFFIDFLNAFDIFQGFFS